MEQKTFTIKDTNIIKGIAIIFMVLHHSVGIYYNNMDLSWYGQYSDSIFRLILVMFSASGKVCVSLLSILSGYGLSQSYMKFKKTHEKASFDVRFILSHLIQFYSIYFFFVLIRLITKIPSFTEFLSNYGEGIQIPVNLFLSCLGISNIFRYDNPGNFGDWFVGAILIMYILFPLMYRLVAKFKLAMIGILIIPWILKFIFPTYIVTSDNVIFYLLAFGVGIYLAQTNALTRLKQLTDKKYMILSVLFVILAFGLRLIFSLPADIFFALSLILLSITLLSKTKFTSATLASLGGYSANIWLFHEMVLVWISLPFPLQFLFGLIIALLISMCIEYIKKLTHYSVLTKRIRKSVEG